MTRKSKTKNLIFQERCLEVKKRALKFVDKANELSKHLQGKDYVAAKTVPQIINSKILLFYQGIREGKLAGNIKSKVHLSCDVVRQRKLAESIKSKFSFFCQAVKQRKYALTVAELAHTNKCLGAAYKEIRNTRKYFYHETALAYKEIACIIYLLKQLLKKNSRLEPKITPFLNEAQELRISLRPLYWRCVAWDWSESIVVALVAAMIIRSFVFQAFKIPTGSMRPSLLEGDIILVNKFVYGAKVPFTGLHLPKVTEPQRGDVIVFIYPEDPKKDFIKRLVALPGETVEIKGGTVYINGQPLVDPVFNKRYYYNRGDFSEEDKKIIVPRESLFVLGDNSASSLDSRYWGFVPRDNVLGKAVVIYWPPKRIRIIR